jgi:chemotaxis protein methyltransferase CheR
VIGHDDYIFLCALLRGTSGLALGPGKEYLLESRLPPVAKTYGFDSLAELIVALRQRPHADLVKAVSDAMTTGETLFFRDTVPFEMLRASVLPRMAERCRRDGRALRIWCAAASTGQEPFSIAMLLAEMPAVLAGVRVELVATEFASHAINRARRGVFTALEVQRGLPERLLRKYFTEGPDGFRLADDIRRRVTFRELNLLTSFRSLGQFDVILCRNVLIYFDALTKKDVLDRLAQALGREGHLFLGATESAFGLTDSLVRVADAATSLHVRREDAAAVEAWHREQRDARPVSPAA